MDELIKVALTLAEASALDADSDRDHWEDFPEVLAAFDVLASGKFEFTYEQIDVLLDTLDPDSYENEPAYVSGAIKLRQAQADYLGWDVQRVNRALGWKV